LFATGETGNDAENADEESVKLGILGRFAKFLLARYACVCQNNNVLKTTGSISSAVPERLILTQLTWFSKAYSGLRMEFRVMRLSHTDGVMTLMEQVETRVRQSTHGRIRNLLVEEVQGRLVIRGQAPSHHTKQLALHGALELLPGDRFSSVITVGPGTPVAEEAAV
jgi:hypothetical protein